MVPIIEKAMNVASTGEACLENRRSESCDISDPVQPVYCVLYARNSTDDQKLENQLLQLRKYAAQQSPPWVVVEEVRDVSASWEGIDRVKEMARQKGFDVLLFWSLSCLARRGSRTIAQLHALNASGVKWHSYTEKYLSSMGPFADAIVSLMTVLANHKKAGISELTKAGLERVRRSGVRLGRPAKDPELARRAQELKAGGKSYAEVAAEMGVSRGWAYQLVTGKTGRK